MKDIKSDLKENKANFKLELKKISFVVIVIGIVVGISFIGKYLYNIYTANQVSKALENVKIYNDKDDSYKEKTSNVLKLKELKKQNNDIMAWIKIDGTNINYPVLQTINNEYYMEHDYLKNISSNGSIFIDKDYNFSKQTKNLVLYGKNNYNYVMFSELVNYKNIDYYNSHKNITLINEEMEENYEIFAVIFTQDIDFASKDKVDYSDVNILDSEEFDKYVQNVRHDTIYNKDFVLNLSDKILTIVTSSNHTEKGKIVIIAKRS